MTKLRKIIKEISQRAKSPSLFKRELFIIKDPLPEHISLNSVIRKTEKHLKPFLKVIDQLDGIYIGEFDFLLEREINAMFFEGSIYISNFQSNESDLVDDLVHEYGHFLESLFKREIYEDGLLEREFLNKRKKLMFLMEPSDYPEEGLKKFMNVDFDPSFDKYLYQDIGYQKLSNLSVGLFPSAYSITSIREYFGIGFEKFFIEGYSNQRTKLDLKEECPVLFRKLELLEDFFTP